MEQLQRGGVALLVLLTWLELDKQLENGCKKGCKKNRNDLEAVVWSF